MKKVIKNNLFGFLLGMLLCSGIVYATNIYKAVDISYKPIDSSWEVNNVSDALNSLYKKTNESNKSSVHYLGTGTSFNIKEICDELNIDTTTLTEDNFIVGMQSIPSSSGSVSTSVNTATKSMNLNGNTISKTYDATTATLTISGNTISARTNATNAITASSTAVCFAYLILT